MDHHDRVAPLVDHLLADRLDRLLVDARRDGPDGHPSVGQRRTELRGEVDPRVDCSDRT